MIRLFVGIPIPADIESHLSMMSAGLPGARWVNEENYHLTLRFIGEVDEGLAGDIDVTLGQINHPIFELSLEGVGYFGKPNAARAVWAGVAKSENLLHLHAKIETALQRMGQPAEERKYTPHVTLARMRGTPKAKLTNISPDIWGLQQDRSPSARSPFFQVSYLPQVLSIFPKRITLWDKNVRRLRGAARSSAGLHDLCGCAAARPASNRPRHT